MRRSCRAGTTAGRAARPATAANNLRRASACRTPPTARTDNGFRCGARASGCRQPSTVSADRVRPAGLARRSGCGGATPEHQHVVASGRATHGGFVASPVGDHEDRARDRFRRHHSRRQRHGGGGVIALHRHQVGCESGQEWLDHGAVVRHRHHQMRRSGIRQSARCALRRAPPAGRAPFAWRVRAARAQRRSRSSTARPRARSSAAPCLRRTGAVRAARSDRRAQRCRSASRPRSR